MNLILTPVHVNNDNSFNVLKEMCQAIDSYTENDFLHILIDDNSKMSFMEEFISPKRRGLKIFSDYSGREHKNQLGQGVQLGLDYARQMFCNEKKNPSYDYVFLIESDVIVREGWDQKMIDVSVKLPNDWITLDCLSVDKNGNITYPTYKRDKNIELLEIEYAEFQCTLFNRFKEIPLFSNLSSHFDILWSRTCKSIHPDGKFYSTNACEVLHYSHTSRLEYM